MLWEGRSCTIPSLEVGTAVAAALCIELTLYVTLSLFPPTFQLCGAPIALKPSICLVDCVDSIFWLSVAMSYIPIMESTKCRRRRGAKPNTHAASGEHPKKRKTNPVGEALDRVVPSVDPLQSGPQQEPDVEDDGFTAFVPLDVEYKELTPPPEQLIFSSTHNNANFLQLIHSRHCLHQGDHWRDVVIVCLIWTYME